MYIYTYMHKYYSYISVIDLKDHKDPEIRNSTGLDIDIDIHIDIGTETDIDIDIDIDIHTHANKHTCTCSRLLRAHACSKSSTCIGRINMSPCKTKALNPKP